MNIIKEPLDILYEANMLKTKAEKLIITVKNIVEIDVSKHKLPILEVDRVNCSDVNDIDVMSISTKLSDITHNALDNMFVLDQMIEEYIMNLIARENIKIHSLSEPRLLFKTIDDMNNEIRKVYQDIRCVGFQKPWESIGKNFVIKSALRSLDYVKMVVFIGYERKYNGHTNHRYYNSTTFRR